MKSLLFAFVIFASAAFAQTGKERRISLSVTPMPKDSIGNDAPGTKLCKQLDTLQKRVCAVEIALQQAESQRVAAIKAIQDYQRGKVSVSPYELCLLLVNATIPIQQPTQTPKK